METIIYHTLIMAHAYTCRIACRWEQTGKFQPQDAAAGKPFSMAMPPPNVTGKLHMGHAMFVTLQDIMTRYARMCNRPTLWLPGTDHAGIATQVSHCSRELHSTPSFSLLDLCSCLSDCLQNHLCSTKCSPLRPILYESSHTCLPARCVKLVF